MIKDSVHSRRWLLEQVGPHPHIFTSSFGRLLQYKLKAKSKGSFRAGKPMGFGPFADADWHVRPTSESRRQVQG